MSGAVVVIGGGVNGLVCATLLARAGRSVTLVEQRTQVGGGATLPPSSRPGSACRRCRTRPARCGATSPTRCGLDAHGLQFVDSPVWMTALDGGGRALTLYRDAARTADALRTESAEDAARWAGFARTRQRLGCGARLAAGADPARHRRPGTA